MSNQAECWGAGFTQVKNRLCSLGPGRLALRGYFKGHAGVEGRYSLQMFAADVGLDRFTGVGDLQAAWPRALEYYTGDTLQQN